MPHKQLREKILEDLNDNQDNKDLDALTKELAKKHDTSQNMIELIIAEWEAGREKVK